MMKAPRLLLLLVLSLQMVVSSRAVFATSSGVPATASSIALKTLTPHPVVPFAISGIDHMAHEADSMEVPRELTDSETWDSASDEGLREFLHFNLAVEGNKTALPRPEQWYNFFRQYCIPPPEVL